MSVIMDCLMCGMSSSLEDAVVTRTCPQCGSDAVTRRQFLELSDTMQVHESMAGMVKDSTRPSNEKVRQRFKSGDDFCKAKSKWVQRELSVDRDNDRYFEKVTDPETGEVIHECDEPLSQHRGHGSAAQTDRSGS